MAETITIKKVEIILPLAHVIIGYALAVSVRRQVVGVRLTDYNILSSRSCSGCRWIYASVPRRAENVRFATDAVFVALAVDRLSNPSAVEMSPFHEIQKR